MTDRVCIWDISASIGDAVETTLYQGTMQQMLLFTLHYYSRSDINPLGLPVKGLNMVLVQPVQEEN
jgi:hypothetical protein